MWREAGACASRQLYNDNRNKTKKKNAWIRLLKIQKSVHSWLTCFITFVVYLIFPLFSTGFSERFVTPKFHRILIYQKEV